jgi:hypothetical protein
MFFWLRGAGEIYASLIFVYFALNVLGIANEDLTTPTDCSGFFARAGE